MKILNATAWKTEDLKAVVERAAVEAKAAGATIWRSAAEFHFKPTNHHSQVRVNEVDHNGRVEIPLWQPIKFKNKLDELTKIAASVEGFRMPEKMAAELLTGLKVVAFGFRYPQSGTGHYYASYQISQAALSEKDFPVIGERLAEEGRRDEAQIDLAQAIIDRANAKKEWESRDRGFEEHIKKLERAIDFNNKKLEKHKAAQAGK